ncbi:MAG: hypothetical protein JWM78_3752 [Verrucomicrobiaceae bacterium]|nr:hypothetical protein [Verrucomicrobiaceae bacterium]
MRQRWDIFCTVIDNFGDAGVCWRLARQLATEYDFEVRLWIDDLRALHRLWPEISLNASVQNVAGVIVCEWRAPFVDADMADVVIEAFACNLPEHYLVAMAQRPQSPLWINLEYLSAEPWVADCHGLASPQTGSAIPKYFFFPGFTENTGGLLRECDLVARRLAFQSEPAARTQFFTDLGVQVLEHSTVISLFAYPSAPLSAWFEALVASPAPILCLVPEGQLLKQVAEFFGGPLLAVGESARRGALTVQALPFLRQDIYDQLLWSCDINCVRGEDSFVRAQWAARPLLWQIYPQQDDAHWIKLAAFFELYKELLPSDAAAALAALWQAWNGRGDMRAAWQNLQPLLSVLRRGADAWEAQLRGSTNLAAALAQFCANHV